MDQALPINEALPALSDALGAQNRVVLAAPPGAGKTTRVPLALLSADWLGRRKILLLEPRRIAARMAAERMARLLGEPLGRTIGLATRVDRRVSRDTRLEVITDGLFARRALNDPGLDDVGAVLFDEFHERSLNLDLGLAFAIEAQNALRPDLRLLIMSATLDTARVAGALGAPVIESRGRMFDVETRYLGRSDDPIEDQAARAVRRALREAEGSILVFLPGRAEISRTAERLLDLPADVMIAPLYGALSPAEQDAAVRPAGNGARKIVLATDIAESSLTIEDVRIVIDAGLSRVAEYDPSGAAQRLVTRKAARANVDQRRGRAGRTAPGICYRLWDEAATRGLPAEPAPEILLADLSGLALACAEWGARDPRALFWIDAPPEGRLAAARADLRAIGAVDDGGAITPRGRDIARLPLDPKLAALIAAAATPADKGLAAEIAALVSERGLGGPSTDLRERIDRFRRDGAPRARALRDQAARWAGGDGAAAPAAEAGRILAAASPLAIARRRPGQHGAYLLASGRSGVLDKADSLANAEWIAVADATGSASAARILAAAPLTEAEALALGGVETAEAAEFDPATKTIRARRVRRIGAIILSETPLPAPSGDMARAALLIAVREKGLDLLPAADAVRVFAARLALARAHAGAGLPDWSLEAIAARDEEWLGPLLGDPPSLDRPTSEQIRRALEALLGYEAARALSAAAPVEIETPAGRRLVVDYLAEGGPMIEARVQEFYGLDVHPSLAHGRAPIAVSLLSPAHRQIALTKNLPAFWSGGYRDMAKDMRGRYPKHDWPDDPARARPHVGKTKARLKGD
jgi:ATP-dependent helicase HrpB